MSTQFDARQSVLRSATSMIGSAVNDTLDTLFPKLNNQLAKLFEDRNALLTGGGTITNTGGTSLGFTGNFVLYLNSNVAGAAPYTITIATATSPWSFSADGKMAYIVITSRSAGTFTLTTDATTLPAVTSANQEVFLIAKRVGSDIEFLNGYVLESNTSGRLGVGGVSASDLINTASSALGDALVGFKQPITGSTAGTVHGKLAQILSVKDFGAAGDGVTNDVSALTTANTNADYLKFPNGTYLISSNITFTKPVYMDSGALFSIPTGVTINFNGGFFSDLHQVFSISGTGAVTFDPQKTSTGYPEWWGAIAGGPDCVTAINKSLIACKITELQSADYFTSAGIEMLLPHRSLVGKGSQYASTTNQVTRIICTSASADIMQVGPTSFPGSVNDLYKGNVVKDLYLVRSVAPSVPSNCTGLLNKYTLYAEFDNIKSTESIYCFRFFGTVQTRAERCWAFRSVAGTGGTDKCYGYFVDGSASIGLNGGNASIYLNICNASMGGISIADSSGFYLDSSVGFTDTFLESPETSAFATGINIQGNSSNTTLNYTNLDLQIKNPILDTFSFAGIYVKNVNKYGSVGVEAGYYGPSSGATAAIYVDSSLGSTKITGGQAVMGIASTTPAIIISSSSGVVIDRTQILECGTYAIDMSSASSCDLKPLVKNNSTSLSGAVIRALGSCSRNIISPIFLGKSNAAPLGIQLVGTTNLYNEINLSGIDENAVTGGANNKCSINSVQVTQPGINQSNLISGLITTTSLATTVQRFTSGSGTYTTPIGCIRLKIKVLGGGGGGAGSTTGAASSGGAGGASTFGTSLLTANGGAGGVANESNSAPGTASVSSPAIALIFMTGNPSGPVLSTQTYNIGGVGGSGPFGGAGIGGSGTNSRAGGGALVNSGSGGGGGQTALNTYFSGGGGASGGYVEAIINNPSTSYSYAIGAGGTAGVGQGASKVDGGVGGSGLIVVEEYYQ